MYNRTQNATPLTRQQLIEAAPSIATATAHESRSTKYIVEPTLHIIETLQTQGLYPIYAAQKATKKADRKYYTKHIVIMREAYNGKPAGEYTPEILITNSHDGSTSRIAELGFFRAVCANGLILNEAKMGKYSSTHIQHNDDFIEGVFSVLATAKDTSTKIEAMKAKTLSFEEAKLFALVKKSDACERILSQEERRTGRLIHLHDPVEHLPPHPHPIVAPAEKPQPPENRPGGERIGEGGEPAHSVLRASILVEQEAPARRSPGALIHEAHHLFDRLIVHFGIRIEQEHVAPARLAQRLVIRDGKTPIGGIGDQAGPGERSPHELRRTIPRSVVHYEGLV